MTISNTFAGKTENLVGKLRERYGIERDDAQKRADAWLKAQNDATRFFPNRQTLSLGSPGRRRRTTATACA
jgi:hypothetical protein